MIAIYRGVASVITVDRHTVGLQLQYDVAGHLQAMLCQRSPTYSRLQQQNAGGQALMSAFYVFSREGLAQRWWFLLQDYNTGQATAAIRLHSHHGRCRLLVREGKEQSSAV